MRKRKRIKSLLVIASDHRNVINCVALEYGTVFLLSMIENMTD